MPPALFLFRASWESRLIGAFAGYQLVFSRMSSTPMKLSSTESPPFLISALPEGLFRFLGFSAPRCCIPPGFYAIMMAQSEGKARFALRSLSQPAGRRRKRPHSTKFIGTGDKPWTIPTESPGAYLPYMDNWRTVLLTVALNVGLSLAVRFGQAELTRADVILHGSVLGLVTSVIDVYIVRARLKKAREQAPCPPTPVRRLMMMLPRNPVLLSLVLACSSGPWRFCGLGLMVLRKGNLDVFAVPGVQGDPGRGAVLKILEFAIFRLVQSDCAPAVGKEATA